MLTHDTHQCMDIMVILDSWILPSWILSINDDNDDYGLHIDISQPASSGILSCGFTWIFQLLSCLRSIFSAIDTRQNGFMLAVCIWVRRKVSTISDGSGGRIWIIYDFMILNIHTHSGWC